MPIYEYQCQACGHQLEALQKISDDPLTRCPSCEAEALKKKVSAAAFRLKGGGWYETDFKSGDKKKNLAGDKDSGGKDSKTTDKKGSDKGGNGAATGSAGQSAAKSTGAGDA